MARMKRNNVKSAETVNEKHSDGNRVRGFIKSEDGFIGTSCCVSLNKNLHVILMAPTSVDLQEALKLLKLKEESSAELVVIMRHEKVYEKPKEVERDPISWKEGLEVIWVYHEPSDVVLMIWRKDLVGDAFTELGPAIKKTEREARLLCRSIGWSIEDAKAVEVNSKDNPDDEIPF